MLTTTETIATTLIWVLTSCGLFFGIRGILKRRRKNRKGTPQQPPDQAD